MTQGADRLPAAEALAARRPDAAAPRVLLTRVVVDPTTRRSRSRRSRSAVLRRGEARRRAAERGWDVAPDAGRGWRRVVPSPQPLRVLGVDHVARWSRAASVVIAAGGGGIPVAARDGRLVGVAGRDRQGPLLGRAGGRDRGRRARAAHRRAARGGRLRHALAARGLRLTVSDALRGLAEGEFPAGSMGPKIESAERFVDRRRPRGGHRRADRLAAAVGGAGRDLDRPRTRAPSRRSAHAARLPGMSWAVARSLRNRYVDSVRLMRVAQAVRAHDGVARARWRWARRRTWRRSPRSACEADARPTDVVIAVEGGRLGDAVAGRARAARAGGGRGGPASARRAPRTLRRGRRANVALISVPGEYAVLEAHRALTARPARLPVLRPRVARADEVALKRRGARARAARHGPRMRHGDARRRRARLRQRRALRAGRHRRRGRAPARRRRVPARRRGRRRVADRRRRRARPVDRGRRDHVRRGDARCSPPTSATETLLLVSKPPARGAWTRSPTRRRRQARGRRVRRLGRASAPFEIHPTLEAGAFAAAGAERRRRRVPTADARGGGARCSACSPAARSRTRRCRARAAPRPGRRRRRGDDGAGHAVLDLGEEEYTQGRPHPMVDLEVRLELLDAATGDGRRLRAARRRARPRRARRPGGGAGRRGPARGRGPTGDRARVRHRRRPAGRRRQEATLRDAGAIVAPTNAARRAAGARGRSREDRDAHLLGEAARRRRARARGLRGARRARPRRRAVRARAARARALPRAAGAAHLVRHAPPDAPFDERIAR